MYSIQHDQPFTKVDAQQFLADGGVDLILQKIELQSDPDPNSRKVQEELSKNQFEHTSIGSGFVASPNLVITNRKAVEGKTDAIIVKQYRDDGKVLSLKANLLTVHPNDEIDLALLEVPSMKANPLAILKVNPKKGDEGLGARVCPNTDLQRENQCHKSQNRVCRRRFHDSRIERRFMGQWRAMLGSFRKHLRHRFL